MRRTLSNVINVGFGPTPAYKHPLILRSHLEVKQKERVKKRKSPLEGRLVLLDCVGRVCSVGMEGVSLI